MSSKFLSILTHAFRGLILEVEKGCTCTQSSVISIDIAVIQSLLALNTKAELIDLFLLF